MAKLIPAAGPDQSAAQSAPQSAAQSATQSAARSAALAQLLDLAEGFDRSWSFGADGVEARALFFLPASDAARASLRAAAIELGFDAAGLQDFDAAYPGADAVGLTLSENGSVRLYLQYWDQMAQRVMGGDTRPGLLYLGIKRWPGRSGRNDGYICLPLAPETAWRPVMQEALDAFGCDRAATRQFLAPLSEENAIWARIENDARSSWLMTLRKTEPDGALLIRALQPLEALPGVNALIAALQHGEPLHLAGGEDAVKGRFLSFYAECDRASMAQFLTELADRPG